MKNKESLLYEIGRYVIVGGLATIVDYGTFALFRYVILERTTTDLLIATALGFTFGVTFNYILSIIFVFKNVADPNKAKKASSFILFALIGLIGLGITEFGMWLNHLTYFDFNGEFWQIPEMLMKVFLTGIVLVWNYVARKLLIFKAPKKIAEEITK